MRIRSWGNEKYDIMVFDLKEFNNQAKEDRETHNKNLNKFYGQGIYRVFGSTGNDQLHSLLLIY